MGAGAKVAFLAAALIGGLALVAFFVADPDDAVPAAPPAVVVAQTPESAAALPHAEKSRRDKPVESPEPKSSAGVRLTGEVIDSDETSVQGATVRAVRDGAVVEEVRTGADGRFTVHCGRRPPTGSVQIGIVAAFGNSRSAFESYELSEDSEGEDDLGQLQLQRAVPLVARVVDAAGPVAGARVFVGTFFGTVFSTATTDARGVAEFDSTPATDAWLFAYAPGHGRARGEIPDERDPKVPLVLTLTARTLRVSVVQMPAGVPAPGERVGAQIVTEADGSRLLSAFVPPLDLPATGDTGIVTIADVAADDSVELRRLARDTTAEPWRAAGRITGTGTMTVAGPREIEARLDVQTGRVVRWRIVPGDVPPPAEGAVVELRRGFNGWMPSMAPAALLVQGGELVGCDFSEGEVKGIAVAADGSIARLAGGEARFTRPRAVGVTVRDADGQPLPGVDVSLRGSASDRVVDESYRTGADGRVSFGGLEPELGLLDVWTRTETPPDGRCVATIELSKGDANLDVRLPRTQEIVLRVTTDGERRLPDAWRLFVNQNWEAAETVEPPADIRVIARERSPGEPIHVLLRADGMLDAEADVECRPGGGPVFVDLACDHGVTLWATYAPPPEKTHLRATTVLQTWSPPTQGWIPWRERPTLVSDRHAEPDGRFRFDGMPPGRYRLFAMMSFPYETFASDVVDTTLGTAPPPLVLDLSRGGTVRVRVVGPDDKPVDGAWVSVEPGGRSDVVASNVGAFAARMQTANGPVTMFVPGDRAVRIVARHAMLRSDPERGSAEVTDPGGEYVLRLIEGAVIEFRLAPVPNAGFDVDLDAMYRDPSSSAIQLFRGPAEGDPVASLTPLVVDGRLRAGGLAPGRYTIWIRLRGGAPIVLEGVDLHEGVNDLGELRPSKGATLRVRLAVPEGQAPPRLAITATRVAPPRYGLSVTSNGEAEIVVAGLGPGRFEVVARTLAVGAAVSFRRTIDSDGVHDVVIDSSPR